MSLHHNVMSRSLMLELDEDPDQEKQRKIWSLKVNSGEELLVVCLPQTRVATGSCFLSTRFFFEIKISGGQFTSTSLCCQP